MPYREDIPGQISTVQLRAIEAVAGLVPLGGHVVEVGSLFGKSSYAWGASVDPSVTVHCLDPWEGNTGVRPMEARYGVRYSKEQFEAYVADLPNVTAHQGYSPADFEGWDTPVDLYYEDAVHAGPILARNLDFWSARVGPSGIVCGDDYRPRFPDVRAGAARLAKRMGRELIVVENFWCLLPRTDDAAVASVKATLLALAEEAERTHAAMGLRLQIGQSGPLQAPEAGEPLLVRGTTFLNSARPWPAEPDGEIVGAVKLVPDAAEDGQPLIGEALVALAPTGTDQLTYDVPVFFEARVPTGELPRGDYRVVFDLYRDGFGWLIGNHARKSSAVLTLGAETAAPPEPDVDREAGPLSAGTRLRFTRDGTAKAHQRGPNWIGTERRHTWTRGERTEMSLPLADALRGRKILLTICLRPYVFEDRLPSQRLRVLVGGRERLSRTLDEREQVAVLLDEADTRGGVLDLVFEHPDAAAPKTVDPSSTDAKPLAFAFSWLSVAPVYEGGAAEAEREAG